MIRKLIRQMLLAQILSALTGSLCLMIDNIMIGRFLGVQAIAAYGLANPILLVLGAFGTMLAAGVQMACSRSLGSGDREETNRGFSSAIGLMLGVALPVTALVLLLRNPIATALGAGTEGELYDMTREYLAGFILGAPAVMAALVLVPFLQMAGQSYLLVVAVGSMTVVDVGLDLLNALVIHGGMFGMGVASTVSYYVAMLIAMIYFLSKKSVFRFSREDISWKKIRELVMGGMPNVVSMAASVVFVLLMNRILMGIGGSAAVAAFSVISTVGGAGNCISTGMNGVSMTLSGILFNEEDGTGLRELLRRLSRYGVLLGIIMGAVLLLGAPLFVRVFIPKAGEAQQMAVLGLRLFALGLIPCCELNALKGIYQGSERMHLTELLNLLEGAVLPLAAALVFSHFWSTTGAWLYFFSGELLTLCFAAVYAWRKKGKVTLAARAFLLLKENFGVPPENLLEMDIHSLTEVTEAAKRAEEFCLRHGQDEKTANHIALCIEEMAGNTVQHGFSEGRDNHLSVRVQHKGDAWMLRFRDDCRAFDPVSYVPQGDRDALGIRLVMAMAEEIRYTYSLNLNNLAIRLRGKVKENA